MLTDLLVFLDAVSELCFFFSEVNGADTVGYIHLPETFGMESNAEM